MGYLVWTKSEFEGWDFVEVKDLEEAKDIILESQKGGLEVMLTQVLPFTLEVRLSKAIEEELARQAKEERQARVEVRKEAESEATETKSSKDKGA